MPYSMERVESKNTVWEYLIEPSPLFLKQVITIVEIKNYILVMDARVLKKRVIPDLVIDHFESRWQHLCQQAYKCQEYDGVTYLLLLKTSDHSQESLPF